MIIRRAPIDNAWYRAAICWFVALLCVNAMAWPIVDFYGIDSSALYTTALAMPLGALLLVGIGRVFEPQRVTVYVAIIGAFGILPLLFGLLYPGAMWLRLQVGAPTTALLSGFIYFGISAFWASRKIAHVRHRIAETNFFDNETLEDKSTAYLNRSPRIDLHPYSAKKNLQEKVENWVLPKLIFLLPLAYVLQRVIADGGKVPAVLALLAVLSTPLAMHVSVKVCVGFYVWIYEVIRFERRIGKPLIFAAS
jgi:hypothetical protein